MSRTKIRETTSYESRNSDYGTIHLPNRIATELDIIARYTNKSRVAVACDIIEKALAEMFEKAFKEEQQ